MPFEVARANPDRIVGTRVRTSEMHAGRNPRIHRLGARHLDSRLKVVPAALEGRARGVQFDVGHGAGSVLVRARRDCPGAGFPPPTLTVGAVAEVALLRLEEAASR